MRNKVIIVGAGGIGSATGLLLREVGNLDLDIYIGDVNIDTANNAVEWIKEGSSKEGVVESFPMPLEGTNKIFDDILKEGDIILDCLPGTQAPRIARLAKKHNLHYANLTEYVRETEEVIEIAKDSDKGFILQTGLAPGFINVLAFGLFKKFCQEYKVTKVDYVTMKVGALTRSVVPPHYYGFTWSPIGVATEYLEPAIVIRDYKKTTRPSLTERERVVIEDVSYEEALTSGGSSDLPDKLEGVVKNLDYKTLRYLGHYSWIESLLRDIPKGDKRADKLENKMKEYVPLAQDDVIIIYASVQGKDNHDNLRIIEKSYVVKPIQVGSKHLRAIQATTAASLAECARLLLTGKYKGPILQTQIDENEFMKGSFVSLVY